MTLRFGTDGVRGLANAELTPELVLELGRAAARTFGCDRIVIGRDTRRSGPLLEAALAAGLASEGVIVERLGVVPTPGVAWVGAHEGIPGAVISASHNPAPDNGVKFFAAGGRKLDDSTEERLEAELDTLLASGTGDRSPTGERIGPIEDRPDRVEAYVAALVASVDGGLDGISLVLDCANGAGTSVGPEVFRRLGAGVEVINDRPDGDNINEGCGSLHPELLAAAVVEAQADVGLALDGDADRVIAVDAEGNVVDGDHIIAICALDRLARGRLPGNGVAVTVMTNLGFRIAMADHGVRVIETPVGDRHVLEAIERGGLVLGGEQSGHVIFRELATTGDGVLTGVQLLDAVRRSGRPLAELARDTMTRLPQVLLNVEVAAAGADVTGQAAAEIAEVEGSLADRGRVLIRPSGTEPVVRVMVEAPTEDEARAAAERLASAIRRATR